MKKAVYFCHREAWNSVYGAQEREALAGLVAIPDVLLTRDNWREHVGLLREAELIVSSWGGPIVDAEFLDLAPNFKLYLYGAGSIRGLMSEAAWARGVRITSAASANAVPVAEFTLSQILFCLKNGWQLSRRCTAGEDALWHGRKRLAGTYGTTVGIVSLGLIGRKVCELLQPFDVQVIAYDPVADPALFETLGVEQVGLEELFRRSEVVSLHVPLLPETEGLVDGRLIESMKPGAALINTARGGLMKESELIDVLRRRPDLTAVLDVTDPEPPAPDSPLRTLPNAVLTPHLAGAFNGECRRLGAAMVDELRRYLRDEPLRWEILKEQTTVMA